jgi:hypothetical protein
MTEEATRYKVKIRPYTKGGEQRYAMFVHDLETGCVEHEDVESMIPKEDVEARLIEKLKARCLVG